MDNTQTAIRTTDAAMTENMSADDMRDLHMTQQSIVDATIDIDPRAHNDDMTPALASPGQPVSGPSIDDTIAALTALIADLHPEARAEAVRRGILAATPVSSRTVRHTESRTVKITKKEPTPLHKCACGCMTDTMSAFAPGHDQRCKGLMVRGASGRLTQLEMAWRPTDDLRTYAATRPAWSDMLAAFDAAMSPVVTEPTA